MRYPDSLKLAATRKDLNISSELWHPHYTDHRFSNDVWSIYIDPDFIQSRERIGDILYVRGAEYEYTDRLQMQFGSSAYVAAWKQTETDEFKRNSPARAEAVLRILYHEPNLRLVHIWAGVVPTSGASYKVFGFIR